MKESVACCLSTQNQRPRHKGSIFSLKSKKHICFPLSSVGLHAEILILLHISSHVLLQVRATDNGSPPRHTDHSLTINILDVNDNTPVIESQRGYNVSVSEVGMYSRCSQPSCFFTLLTCTWKQASLSMWLSERGRGYVSSPCDGHWPRHWAQRHVVLLHHCRQRGPDLSHGPHDRGDGDATGASWPGAPARVPTHGHCGGWWHATAVGKIHGINWKSAAAKAENYNLGKAELSKVISILFSNSLLCAVKHLRSVTFTNCYIFPADVNLEDCWSRVMQDPLLVNHCMTQFHLEILSAASPCPWLKHGGGN